MIKYVIGERTVEIPLAIECDRCGAKYFYESAVESLEIQEFHCIDFIGGYSSVFGDGTVVKCDLCQHCLKELIGKYCRVE